MPGWKPKFRGFRHSDLFEDLYARVLGGAAKTPLRIRQAIVARARALTGSPANDAPPVADDLEAYVDKVSLHSYKVLDRDIEALRRSGYSDDQIFEITLSAGVGACATRLEAGLEALRGQEEE